MPSTSDHGPKRAILYVILYARVSTDEQARSGYSLAQQLDALREYASREGYEVLEEIIDPGQSGASLERPGMDHVRDLVAAGGVSVVLAQDRDRFAREPAYLYLLKQEFAEYGTKIRSLNDRGDDSPEGELTDGILDQLAKFERAKTAERSRRGKLRKAREGKIVAGHTPNYGFRFNAERDGYEVDEDTMPIVQRIFRMIGMDGATSYGVVSSLEQQGTPGPRGGRWNKTQIRRVILGDVYRPHTFEEISEVVKPEVAAKLDPEKYYGIWWFNRRRVKATYISEPFGTGKRYRRRNEIEAKDQNEWIAVPVPDAGVPREVVDAARAAIKDNRSPSNAGRRFWELSGGIMRCAVCDNAMVSRTATRKNERTRYYYYLCCQRTNNGPRDCTNTKCFRAEEVEEAIWKGTKERLCQPDQLRADLDAMIEQKRAGSRGDPDQEVKTWLNRIEELDRQRGRAQDLAIEGLLNHEELRAKLAYLENARATAKRELEALSERREDIEGLERDRDALLAYYADLAPQALDVLAPEERHHLYKMLRLRVVAEPDGDIEVVCRPEPTSYERD